MAKQCAKRLHLGFFNCMLGEGSPKNCRRCGSGDQRQKAFRDRIGHMKSTSPDPARHLAIAKSLFLLLALEQPNRALILVSLINDPTDVNSPMNAPVRLTQQNGEASGRFRLASIEASLIMVIGVVSAGIGNLTEQPTRAP